EVKLYSVAILFAQDGIGTEFRRVRIGGTTDGAVLHLIGNMQIAPAIVVRAEFTLQVSDELAERLLFFRHDIGQQERVEDAVAFGEKAAVSYAPGFLSADQNFVVHHQIGNVFEADVAFVQLASVLGGDAVHHAGGVEGAHHIARPLLVLQQPVQQNAHALVRIDEAAIFGHSANAVGIAVGDQAGVAFFLYYGLLQQGDVRQDRFGINAGE